MKALVKGQLEALPHTHLTRRQVLIDKLTVLDRDTSLAEPPPPQPQLQQQQQQQAQLMGGHSR
jgi:hypothetical protein